MKEKHTLQSMTYSFWQFALFQIVARLAMHKNLHTYEVVHMFTLRGQS